MFEQFLNILGVHHDADNTQAPAAAAATPTPTTPTTTLVASSEHSTAAPSEGAEQLGGESRRDQIQQLAKYLGSVKVKPSTQKRIVESVRQVSEVVIWSDRRNPELLSYVVEVDLHRAMLRLLCERRGSGGHRDREEDCVVAVTVQILQTLSIILDGITDTTFLYSLFSNNFVNDLIAAPVDLDNDEVLAYYVAFLKALSLKLTPDTIHFFFNERLDDFPLYTTAISLFDHPDSMVRVAVRAITLNVFRINDQEALEFILAAPACAHFWQMIMRALKDCYDDAFRILVDMPTVTPRAAALQGAPGSSAMVATTVVDNTRMTEVQEWAAVDQILENHMGLLAYLNDIYGLGVERINRRVTDEFIDRILVRTYVHVIEIGWRAGASAEESLFMQVVTLFLSHFFAIIKYSPLLADTINALLVAAMPGDLDAGNGSDRASAALSDHYGGDIPTGNSSAGGGSGGGGSKDNSIGRSSGLQIVSDEEVPKNAHLGHPFAPSPFEPSRTLMPWLCVSLEVLYNKAIGPTTLVKSVLTPRRMLRTRALLESLTGQPTLADCCSSSAGSALTVSPSLAQQVTSEPIALSSNGAGGGGKPANPTLPLPPPTQSILTSLVQILADSPASHSWPTVALAALLVSQLARNSRGQIQLDAGLSEELAQAQHIHSAELRGALVSVIDGGDSDVARGGSSDGDATEAASRNMIACGFWKVLVKCLVDLANSSSQTLRNKIQSESRHIFSLDRPASVSSSPLPAMPDTPQSVMQRLVSVARNRRSSTSSATVNPTAPPVPQRLIRSTRSSRTSLATTVPSPFDSDTPHEAVLLATIHQAFYLKRLCQSANIAGGSPKNAASGSGNTDPAMAPSASSSASMAGDWLSSRGVYADDLAGWLGTNAALGDVRSFDATVVDNRIKRALPRGALKLGFRASVACRDGCLVIRQKAHDSADDSQKKQEALEPDLVWPLADVVVTENNDGGTVADAPYTLRLADTEFPELFFPPRPRSLGGLNVASMTQRTGPHMAVGGMLLSPRGRAGSTAMKPKLLPYSYFATQHGLDISLRFSDKNELADAAGLLQEHVGVSRRHLARIYLDHNLLPKHHIPYLSPAQKITEDTVFYRRSWREPFEYDIKVYASQSDSIPVHNATAFFENAQLLWHVQPQSLEKKYPKHSTKVNVKIPPSVFHESIWSRSNIYVHVFIQRSDQFMPHPNVTDPYLVHTSKEVLNKPDIYYDGTWENSELNNTSSTTVHKYRVPYWSLLSWDLVLEDHMHTSETLPKAFRPWINDSPNDESNPGTYNPPLIYRKTEGYRNMATYILEMMPKSTGSSNRTSLPASTERTASIDVELKIQGIAQGWVRGEEAIVKLAERKYERKTKTITESPRYHRSESSVAYGGVHSDQFGSAMPTAAVSSDNIGGAHLSNSDMSELEGHESETLASAPENVREVVYVDYINGFLPEYILSYASVLNVILYVFSVPLAVALLLTELGDTVAFWSRENTKWEGTSRLVVVLEVVYQCGHLVLVHTDGWIYYTDTTYFDTRPRSIKVFLMRFYAGLSLWVFAALYNIPLNPFMWRRRIFSLHAPPPSEITKPVLAGNDDGSSTTTRAGKLPRMCSRDLAISTQQEIDQRFNRLLLWLGIPSLVLYPVYITTMSRDYLRDSDPVYVVKNVLYMIRAFQLLPQVVINYRTKSVAWIPITAYMCELLINIHQMLATWVIAWPVFFKLVPAGTNLIHCLLLAVFAVQWARYYKAKQD